MNDIPCSAWHRFIEAENSQDLHSFLAMFFCPLGKIFATRIFLRLHGTHI
jgi:hypothetical protein